MPPGGSLWACDKYGEKSLHRCGECGKWWWPNRGSYGRGAWWRVHWWHFRLRRRVRYPAAPAEPIRTETEDQPG